MRHVTQQPPCLADDRAAARPPHAGTDWPARTTADRSWPHAALDLKSSCADRDRFRCKLARHELVYLLSGASRDQFGQAGRTEWVRPGRPVWGIRSRTAGRPFASPCLANCSARLLDCAASFARIEPLRCVQLGRGVRYPGRAEEPEPDRRQAQRARPEQRHRFFLVNGGLAIVHSFGLDAYLIRSSHNARPGAQASHESGDDGMPRSAKSASEAGVTQRLGRERSR